MRTQCAKCNTPFRYFKVTVGRNEQSRAYCPACNPFAETNYRLNAPGGLAGAASRFMDARLAAKGWIKDRKN